VLTGDPDARRIASTKPVCTPGLGLDSKGVALARACCLPSSTGS
jgi:hypothetical protein